MPAITHIHGRALVVRGHDIDTDRIIPARFLKAITFEGLEAHVFADDRQAARADAPHPFDQASFRGAAVLVANENFGCGSSREHAPQAIARWGIRAIVGESFAEIFFSNALAIGLVCVTAGKGEVARLMDEVERMPSLEVSLDLPEKRVTAGALTFPVAIPRMAHDALLSGEWDATGLLLDRYEEVGRMAASLPYGGGGRRSFPQKTPS